MDQGAIIRLMAELTGNILPGAAGSEEEIRDLQASVIESLMLQTESPVDKPLRFDRPELLSTELLQEGGSRKILKMVEQAAEKARTKSEDAPLYKVFRREFPIASSALPGAVPEWARGAKVAKTLGPFTTATGRPVWFDFFTIVKLIPVYLGNETYPSALVPMAALAAKKKEYLIQAGSVYINSSKICPGVAENLYTAFLVKSGKFVFAQDAELKDSKIQTTAINSCTLEIEPEQPEKGTTDLNDAFGIDAKKSVLKLPGTFQINLTTKKILKAGEGTVQFYGNSIRLTYSGGNVIQYNELNRICIPYKPDVEIINIKAASKFAGISGEVPVSMAYWALHTAAIDLANPPAAGITGGFMFQGKASLSIGWPGLKDLSMKKPGRVKLPSPLILITTDRICISETTAENTNAREQFKFWNNDKTGFRSYADLRFSASFPLQYNSFSDGTETISGITNAEVHADRPLKVNGESIPISSKNSLFLLSYSKAIQTVFLFDNDVLQDMHPAAPGSAVEFTGLSVALENALLNISPCTAFGLFGELKTEDIFEKAIWLSAFGLIHYLPTLPDPYTANVRHLQRRDVRYNNKGQPVYTPAAISRMLIAMTGWPADPGAEMQHPILSFHMVDAQQPAAGAAAANANHFPEIPDIYTKSEESIVAKMPNTVSGQFVKTLRGLQEAEKRTRAEAARLFPNVSDIFSLLDVSTHADLMGVSLGYINDDFIFRQTHKPNPQLPQGSPVQIQGMQVVSPGKYVRAFTTPLISWEPFINLTMPPSGNPNNDPMPGLFYFPNDGGPSRIFNTTVELVPVAPIPVTEFIIKNAEEKPDLPAWSVFTLPFGMRALAVFYKDSYFYGENNNNNRGAKLSFNRPEFEEGAGGLQIKITGAEHPNRSDTFEGFTLQEANLLGSNGVPTNNSILGFSVTKAFNKEFFNAGELKRKGVPLERIDISGYGASMFSNWTNPIASFGKTSQAKFNVFKGRTAHEVVQIRSIIYPWGITVVRTITIYRTPNGFVFRHDSGWVAETDGLFDFSARGYKNGDFSTPVSIEQPFEFHPGIIKGVFNVKNIYENELDHFQMTMNVAQGKEYIDPDTEEIKKVTDAGGKSFEVYMVPVYFDAEVAMDFVKEGAVNGRVPSKKMLGYVQLSPVGMPVTKEAFRALLEFNADRSLGGPVDCLVDIGNSGQQMRVTRVDVNPSVKGSDIVFAVAAKGAVILPQEGSWSVVQHNSATDEVTPVTNSTGIPLLKEGKLDFEEVEISDEIYNVPKFPSYNSGRFKIANSMDLFKDGDTAALSYGFLQNTDTQKVLFKNPEFQMDVKRLLLNHKSVPKIADAYRLLNSAGIFPNLADTHNLDLFSGDFVMDIVEKGYNFVNKVNPSAVFEQLIPSNVSWKLVDEEKIKIYIEYAARDRDEGVKAQGAFKFDLNAEVNKWVNKMNDVTLVVDLLDFKRILLIRGKFDTEKGKAPEFLGPELEFGHDLQVIVDILEILIMLATEPDYKDLLKKGLSIVMSNSPGNWEYKFSADKEIPVVKFPPAYLDGPTTPLRLEAGLKVGCYFNMPFPMPGTGVSAPSAGAFIDFYGKLSVMCMSVGVGTIYAIGKVNLRLSADTARGPMLDMEFSFAAELLVGLPVIGNVSISFGAGVIIHISNDAILVGALIFFKGRAEILGGIVTVTIFIEASGKVLKQGGQTNCIAQVTFALDISICFIIDISFEEKWQESKQIA